MAILVTGASGFSGAFVARALARAGHDVVGLYRRDTAFCTALAQDARIRLVRSDLANAAALPGPFDAIVHAAATSPAPGVTTAQIVRDNADATLGLLEAALAWRSRAFIFCSSLSIYGHVTQPILDEATPIVDPDVYGATKLLGERLLAERADTLPGLALRLPGVVGPGAHRNWLSGLAARLAAREPIEAFHLDAPFNNAVHVSDLTSLVVRALRNGWEGFDTVVLGARGTITVRQAIERLAQGLGATACITERPAPKPAFTLSSRRAIDRWGFDPMEIGALIDRYAAEVREVA